MSNENQKVDAGELHEILSSQLRQLSKMSLDDKNIMKCVAKSKEVFNGAGKLIALANYHAESQSIGVKETTKNLLE